MSETATVGATLSVAQTITLFTVLMPPVGDVNRHNMATGDRFTDDVRQSEFVAGTLSLTVGAIMARIEKSWTPLVATGALVVILVFAYEYTLRKPGAVPNLYAMNKEGNG